MAAPKQIFLLTSSLVIVTSLLSNKATTQSNNCSNVLVNLSPCLDYITGNSTTPTKPCCSRFGTVVNSDAQCLCMLINGEVPSLGISVNRTQALALPAACDVQTPPLTQCHGPTDAPSSETGTDNAPSPGFSRGNVTVQAPIIFLPFFLLLAMMYILHSGSNL